jgi:formylglycine-generating enzyme required for sulfatase activity
VEIEGGLNSGVDVQFPGEDFPRRSHDSNFEIGPLIVDKFPVTNQKYYEFLQDSHYVPTDRAHFLEQNFAEGRPRPGWEQKPVTYVSLEDARQYCAHYKKRLPHAFEWQYFAQGTDGRLYPWGNSDNASLTPAVSNDWVNPGPELVGAHPGGASPFGVQDLVRSVWQYTDEFQDLHTRAVVVRGGSNYWPWRGTECRWIENDDGSPRVDPPACFKTVENTPVPGSAPHLMGGSMWYFPPAFALNTYNKYFLMSGSYERAGTLGFRCVADAQDRHCGMQCKTSSECGADCKTCNSGFCEPA